MSEPSSGFRSGDRVLVRAPGHWADGEVGTPVGPAADGDWVVETRYGTDTFPADRLSPVGGPPPPPAGAAVVLVDDRGLAAALRRGAVGRAVGRTVGAGDGLAGAFFPGFGEVLLSARRLRPVRPAGRYVVAPSLRSYADLESALDGAPAGGAVLDTATGVRYDAGGRVVDGGDS